MAMTSPTTPRHPRFVRGRPHPTHNWKLSLYLGAQLLFLDLVANLRFLSLS